MTTPAPHTHHTPHTPPHTTHPHTFPTHLVPTTHIQNPFGTVFYVVELFRGKKMFIFGTHAAVIIGIQPTLDVLDDNFRLRCPLFDVLRCTRGLLFVHDGCPFDRHVSSPHRSDSSRFCTGGLGISPQPPPSVGLGRTLDNGAIVTSDIIVNMKMAIGEQCC